MVDIITATLKQLQDAKQNLENIQNEFSNDQILFDIYETSAKEMVSSFEKKLQNLLSNQYGIEILLDGKKNIDVWVHVKGKNFKNGEGPIEFIGTYFNKLNTACKNILTIMDPNTTYDNKDSMFYLADTAKGSLKLGLKKNIYTEKDIMDIGLYDKKDIWDNIKYISMRDMKVNDSLKLLFEIIKNSDSDKKLNQIKDKFNNDDSFARVLNYVKELIPSNKSDVDTISFEQANKKNTITANAVTRKQLVKYARNLLSGKKFIEGTALIRSQDIDNKKLFARPLLYNNNSIDNLECKLYNKKSAEIYLNKMVNIDGFMIYGKNNVPIRLDVKNIKIKDEKI